MKRYLTLMIGALLVFTGTNFEAKTGIADPGKKTSWLYNHGITVVGYHQVVADAEFENSKNPFTVRLSEFKKQIGWLKQQGFSSISLKQFFAYLAKKNTPLPDKPLLLTFDDGVDGITRHALPILNQAGYRAAVFVIPQKIKHKTKPFLDWTSLKKLSRQGFEIESHSYSHPFLATYKSHEQRYELKQSSHDIKKFIGSSSRYFAYPFGLFNADSLEALKRQGYEGAFTMFLGSNYAGDEAYFATRYMVLGNHSLEDFENRLKVRGLQIKAIKPEMGGRISHGSLVKIKVPTGLDKSRMRIGFGRNFMGNNPSIKFHYNARAGHVAFKARVSGEEYLVATVHYFDEDGADYQNSVLFLTKTW